MFTPLARVFLRVANRLLGREAWALQRLAPFAGKAVMLIAPPLPDLLLEIATDGTLALASLDHAPAASIRLTPDILAELAGRDRTSWADRVQIAGDEALARALRELMRELRWDVEEDLSRVGDAAAHRLGRAARSFSDWQRDVRQRLIENVLEYAIDERRLVPRRSELSALSGEIEDFALALNRLEARISLLDRDGAHPGSP